MWVYWVLPKHQLADADTGVKLCQAKEQNHLKLQDQGEGVGTERKKWTLPFWVAILTSEHENQD